ncbi:hypothetical protein AWB71_01271 [Caballeronia peredens]|nr:hypothetical protein AWB71_01271 [Caballeronia peredens]
MNEVFKFARNTPEEEAEIQRGIDMDPTTYVLSDEEFAQLRPFVRRTFKPEEQATTPDE